MHCGNEVLLTKFGNTVKPIEGVKNSKWKFFRLDALELIAVQQLSFLPFQLPDDELLFLKLLGISIVEHGTTSTGIEAQSKINWESWLPTKHHCIR